MTPPIRFLAIVVGGWTIARSVMLIADAQTTADEPLPLARVARTTTAAPPAVPLLRRAVVFDREVAEESVAPSLPLAKAGSRFALPMGPGQSRAVPTRLLMLRDEAGFASADARSSMPTPTLAVTPIRASTAPVLPTAAVRIVGASRWSGSTWMLARGAGDASGASNGVLGGSQVGARVLWRVNDDLARPLSLGLRVSSPLRRDGLEAAVGVEWQPFAGVPVRLTAERRQRVSGEGRSAWAVLAHGGVGDRPVAAGFRLDAYAQAGIVGARTRDLFVDGGATLVRPLAGDRPDAIAAGLGAWGGMQPGASRLDVGPRVTTTLAAAGKRARVSLDWRFRVAGESVPASGPSLTIGTDF